MYLHLNLWAVFNFISYNYFNSLIVFELFVVAIAAAAAVTAVGLGGLAELVKFAETSVVVVVASLSPSFTSKICSFNRFGITFK